MSRSEALEKLPVRLFPQEGEGAKGYLMRLATKNGVDQIGRLARAAEPTETELQELLGRDDTQFWKSHAEKNFWFNRQSKGNIIWNWINRKCCPACLREAPYWRTEWELRTLTACSAHGARLIDNCPTCNKILTWTTNDVAHCECGQDLRTIQQESASPEEVMLAQACKAAVGLGTGPEEMQFLRHLDSRGLQSLIQYLGTLGSTNNTIIRNTAREVKDLIPIFVQASMYAAKWPEIYIEHLQHLYDLGEGVSGSKSLSAVFGGTYKQLRRPSSRQMKFVKDEFEQYLRENWPWAIGKNHRFLSEETKAHSKWLPSIQAAKQLQVRRETVLQMIERGDLEGRAHKTASGRPQVVVLAQSLKRVQETRSDDVNLTGAAEILGVTDSRVVELVDANIISALSRPERAHPGQWKFSRNGLNEFLNGVKEAPSTGAIVGGRSVPMRALAKAGLRGSQVFPRLIRAIVDGELPVASRSKDQAGISSWVLARDEYDAWRDRYFDDGRKCYTIPKMAEILAVKQEIAYKLVNSGLIEAQTEVREGRKIRLIAEEEVQRFQNRFVANSVLAREIKWSPRHLMQEFSALGVHPFKVKKQQIFRKAMYEKDERFEHCWEKLRESRGETRTRAL